MPLADDGRIAIEVGLNESATKEDNPHVAYGAEEVAADAAGCASEGAAIGHFHVRLDDGTQDWAGAEIYRRAMALTAKLSDIVLYPSYLGDHADIWSLCGDPPEGAPLTMASFDVVQEITRPVMWDEATSTFREPPFEVAGEARGPSDLVDRFRALGLCVTVGAFDIGQLRWAVLAIQSGFIPTPCHVKIFLFDQLVTGPFADEAGLDAYLSQVPPGLDIELTVVPYTMVSPERAEALLRASIRRGCNVRVGIGDNPSAYPDARNAELVARAVELVREAGYEPATPTEVRDRLQLARMSTRLFTDAELAALAETPRARLTRHLAAADLEAFERTALEFDRAHRGSVDGYSAWLASTVRHVLEEHPADAAALFDELRRFDAVYPGERIDLATTPRMTAAAVVDLARTGDVDTALAAWDELTGEWRARNDLGRDLVSFVLSFVYRRHGPDGLEAAIRRGGTDTLVGFLATDIARGPEKRLLSTTRMLHGHFTVFTVTEDDEKFTIHQDPCGTCTTQLADGRYAPPLDLAVVREVHPVTGRRGDTPVYRTHIPVMHVLMARERIGVPWPLPMCPAGTGTGPCPSHIFKDPLDPRGNEVCDGPGGWDVGPGPSG